MRWTQGAEDFRADAQLHDHCSGDAKKHCSDVEPASGRVQDCLVRCHFYTETNEVGYLTQLLRVNGA